MAIKMVKIQCPACCANLDVDGEREYFVCEYCGTRIMLHDENKAAQERANYQAETDRIIRMKEMEHFEKETDNSKKAIKKGYIVALCIGIPSLILMLIPPYVVGLVGVSIAAIIALHTSTESMIAKNEAELNRPVPPGHIMIKREMYFSSEQNYNDVVLIFQTAGFTNISTAPVFDIGRNIKKNGTIAYVAINGNRVIRIGSIYPETALVQIYYHCIQQ